MGLISPGGYAGLISPGGYASLGAITQPTLPNQLTLDGQPLFLNGEALIHSL